MKRLLSVFSVFVLVALLLVPLSEALSQVVKTKHEWMSPGRRSSGEPNYTAPAGPYYVSPGISTVGKGMKAYLFADTTGSGKSVVTSFAWSFVSKPTGSTAVFDSTDKKFTSFTADAGGRYIVQVSVNGGAKTAQDTIWASTFKGTSTSTDCAPCHRLKPSLQQFNNWKTSKHATIFARGITGQLENDETTGYKGAYAKTCAKCHTTGWEDATNNGNFGYLAKQAGWDTTWYKGLQTSGGDYLISYKDSTVWKGMSSSMQALGTIGCESCHGPGTDHVNTTDKDKISISLDGGVCNTCHDAPKKHRLGSYWLASNHATLKTSSAEASNAGCRPCHNGDAFVKYADAWSAGLSKPAPADSARITVFPSIACATCHDPHGNSNPNQLRVMKIDSLANGYKVPVGLGGKAQLCMNCHHGRENTVTRVNNQKGRFADRFYPHYSPQADMFLGANAWEFGLGLTGYKSHGGVKDGCVTCHMSERVNGSSVHADHEMSMEENGADKVEACKECHGSITRFDDIRAATDYDNDGTIESAVAEVQGLLDQLKAQLPKDATGEPVTAAKDSMVVKNHPRYPTILGPLWNYHFVTHDMSKGIHNTKYAVALLRASLAVVTGVEMDPLPVPKTFELSQNYPNPFNPTTEIRFSLPKESAVKIVVFDMIGRLVTTLVDQRLASGSHRVSWNGRDQNGGAVSSGVYFYHMQTEGFTATKKMVLIK